MHTARLVMRRWRESDREPCAAMTADPEVMRYFPARPDRAASDPPPIGWKTCSTGRDPACPELRNHRAATHKITQAEIVSQVGVADFQRRE